MMVKPLMWSASSGYKAKRRAPLVNDPRMTSQAESLGCASKASLMAITACLSVCGPIAGAGSSSAPSRPLFPAKENC